jgi:pimeloyl-ACP methyl ester carboxylesterase
VDSRSCALPPTDVTLGGNELYDAEAALKFLSAVDGAAIEKIGTMGFSMGGATAIRLAARNPQILAVVRDGGFSDLDLMLAPPDNASIQQKIFQNPVYWLFSLRTKVDPKMVNPRQDISLISPRPVFLIYGEAESDYGKNQFEAAYNPKELWIVPAGTHGTNHVVAPEEYKRRVLDFFDQALLK